MATRYHQSRAKLVDREPHRADADADAVAAVGGTGTELILVEGDSAMHSVVAVRNPQLQAVLPLQGKPLNAWNADAAKVAHNLLFRQLADALGLAQPTALSATELGALRFERVALLFDPDADGIHIGALMVLYFQRWLPGLIDAGRLWMVRAPMFELVQAAPTAGDAAPLTRYAYHPAQCRDIADALRRSAAPASNATGPSMCEPAGIRTQAFRGLGSIAPDTLRTLCVNPATRVAHAVTANDVRAVIETFGGETNANTGVGT
jgi:DNA gyrase subunit B